MSTRTTPPFPPRRSSDLAEKDGRLAGLFRPARHPFQKRQLLPELGVGLEVGCLAPGGDVDVLDPDSAIEQRADMPRLAIVLPVMGVILANRHLAQDRHAMMHRLAVDDVEIIAELRSEEHTSELQSLMRISYAVFCL